MPQDRYRRRFGDRREGRLLRSLAPIYRLAPFTMKDKASACDYFSDSVEVTNADRFIRRRAEDMPGLGMLHLFIASYVRTVAMRPALNRFVSGQRIYARHTIDVIMTVTRPPNSDADETSVKVRFDPSDTIYDVYRRVSQAVDAIMAGDGAGDAEDVASALVRIPRVLLRGVVGLLKLLDYFGRLPRSLMQPSPYHGSLLITDFGPLGISPICRHLYNLGNLPVSLSLGARRRTVELDQSGAPAANRYIDYKFALDSRICDGHYYSSAFKFMKHFLKNPESLEQPPERVYDDIF